MLANAQITKRVDELASNDLRRLFLTEFAESGNVYNTCKKLGISRSLPYTQWKDDEEFQAQFKQVRESLVDAVEGNLFHEGLHNQKNTTAQIFLLKCWRPERYAQDERLMGPINVTINYNGTSSEILNRLGLADEVPVQVDDATQSRLGEP